MAEWKKEWDIYEEFFSHYEELDDKGGDGDDEDEEEREDDDDNKDQADEEDEEAYARDDGEYGVFNDIEPNSESESQHYESSTTQDSTSIS